MFSYLRQRVGKHAVFHADGMAVFPRMLHLRFRISYVKSRTSPLSCQAVFLAGLRDAMKGVRLKEGQSSRPVSSGGSPPCRVSSPFGGIGNSPAPEDRAGLLMQSACSGMLPRRAGCLKSRRRERPQRGRLLRRHCPQPGHPWREFLPCRLPWRRRAFQPRCRHLPRLRPHWH